MHVSLPKTGIACESQALAGEGGGGAGWPFFAKVYYILVYIGTLTGTDILKGR